MDAALRFGLGHTLDTVHPALILEPVIGPCAVHSKDGFLDTAQLRLVEVQHLQLPAPALHVHGVHPHQAVGKQCGLFAARTAAQLHDDAFAIVDILGQQQNFKIIFQLRHFLTFFADLLLYHFLKVRIKGLALEQGFGLSKMILRRDQGLIGLHHGFRLVILLHQTAEQRGICRCFRLVQADGKFFKPVADSSIWESSLDILCSSPYMTQWLLGSAGLEHFLDVFFNFRAGQHDLTAAARAADLEIHTDPEHLEAGSSARVFFAGLMVSPTAISIFLSLLPPLGGAVPCAAGFHAAHTDIV